MEQVVLMVVSVLVPGLPLVQRWGHPMALVVGAVVLLAITAKAAQWDRRSPGRAAMRLKVRRRWQSLARSVGLAVNRDRRQLVSRSGGRGPDLVALLTGPIDQPRPRSKPGPARQPIERLPKVSHGRASFDRGSVVWRLRPARGQTVEDVAERRGELADGMGVHRVVVRRTGPAKGELVAFLRDPFAVPAPWRPVGAPSSLAWGVDEHGALTSFPLGRGHFLVAGATGAGKSAMLNSLIAQAAVRPDVALIGIDLKIVELAPWASRFTAIATDRVHAQALLDAVAEEVVRRFGRLQQAGLRRMVEAVPPDPWVVVVIDELAELAGSIDKASLVSISRLARACGIHLVVATQRPSAESLSSDLRDQLGWRWCGRVPSPETARMVLGPDVAGVEPWKIGLDQPGLGVLLDDRGAPRLARAWWLEDREVEQLATATAVNRLALPWLPTIAPAGSDEDPGRPQPLPRRSASR